jgi:hypothetical protein
MPPPNKKKSFGLRNFTNFYALKPTANWHIQTFDSFIKIFISENQNKDWQELANQTTVNGRQVICNYSQNNNYKIGLNILANRFHILGNKLKLEDFNLSPRLDKNKMKSFLKPPVLAVGVS